LDRDREREYRVIGRTGQTAGGHAYFAFGDQALVAGTKGAIGISS
jgi:hypothetical protein